MSVPRWLTASAAAVTAAAALVGPAPTSAGGALVAAHRGGAALWPENSLLAFRNAIALGVDYLETDVHLTADAEVVVVHDPTLERTTTGRGAVRDARLADLDAVRLKAPDGAVTGEPLPTLRALLDLVASSPVRLLLEIKVGPDRRPYAGIEDKVRALIDERALRDRVVVMAFEAPTLQRMRALDGSLRLALLVSRGRAQSARGGSRELMRWVTDAGATDLGIDHHAVDADVVAAARAAGIRVATWTVNDEADLRRVLGLGVDLVISDRPDLARRLAAGRP